MTTFSKMHSLGNDFVIINALDTPFSKDHFNVPELANRHTGIGFDQLLIVEKTAEADFFCRIYNADASSAEQCGNGLRCLAYYLVAEKLTPQLTFTIATLAGVFQAKVNSDQTCTVTLGAPDIIKQLHPIELSPKDTIYVSIISLGNPHAILRLNDSKIPASLALADKIAAHELFPNGANVGFMNIIHPRHIKLETYERGAGKTFACGSNACAAVVAGVSNAWLEETVRVEFALGFVEVRYDMQAKQIYLTGPVTYLYTGTLQNTG